MELLIQGTRGATAAPSGFAGESTGAAPQSAGCATGRSLPSWSTWTTGPRSPSAARTPTTTCGRCAAPATEGRPQGTSGRSLLAPSCQARSVYTPMMVERVIAARPSRQIVPMIDSCTISEGFPNRIWALPYPSSKGLGEGAPSLSSVFLGMDAGHRALGVSVKPAANGALFVASVRAGGDPHATQTPPPVFSPRVPRADRPWWSLPHAPGRGGRTARHTRRKRVRPSLAPHPSGLPIRPSVVRAVREAGDDRGPLPGVASVAGRPRCQRSGRVVASSSAVYAVSQPRDGCSSARRMGERAR